MAASRYFTAFPHEGTMWDNSTRAVTMAVNEPNSRDFAANPDTRRWTGRILMAVILGAAIWNLVVSVMDFVVVPWIGGVMGQSSGLPTSFVQRPYDYPDLFVSVLKFCVAGIVAVSINWFFQRPGKAGRIEVVKPAPPARPALEVVPAPPVRRPVPPPVAAPPQAAPALSAPPAAAPVEPRPQSPPAVVQRTANEPPPAATPEPAKPSKPAKPKKVYYNIVGEAIEVDED
jgi:hypothetical protein